MKTRHVNYEDFCAAGVRLDGFLAESEGPIRDPDLSNFAKDYQFWSLESGSGESPDRAQICPMMMCVSVSDFFVVVNPILDQQNGILVEETRKETSKKVILH